MKEMFEFLDNLLSENDTLVVGTSGGPDSMFLLHVLNTYMNKLNLKIICAHVNHNLREESEQEKIFVENYAVINNDIFEYMKIEEYKNNKFTEDEARRIRYKFFEDLMNKYDAKYLFTAHHGDDLIETIMMRITRGSLLKGYAGINMISAYKNYKIVRPLLYLTKDEIVGYLDDNNIEYALDKSNDSLKYTRNRYRKQLLPFLKKEEKNIHKKFFAFSKEIERYQNFVDRLLEDKEKEIVIENYIIIDKLLNEDEFIQEQIVDRLISKIQKEYIFSVSKQDVSNIIQLCYGKNTKINLKDNFVARKSYNKLYIEKNTINKDYSYILDDEIIIDNKYTFKKLDNSSQKSNYIIRLNSKDIELPLIIRNKKDGDRIKVKNLNGSKKVKDIFIDEKIDKNEREIYPLLTDSKNEVLWVPGIKKSIFDKEKNETFDITIKFS